ncbi:LysR family transcriptional regulator [Rhizobiaceae bacterium n13]|uniref:LysR family transcriptional regulator n=1 Tax=Ferirhizobium litorale TaxID=2927786 RepID=A0AAE3U4L7_9HYPH|nr:LysR family transcriptional regulator [Fererhizobium litorale]MDI7864897.1 LysR family transcriptional regulator [Fererhizobium litorale]MDI7925017.1 LysR family transcriptional regulator [Fererhizobium litorale]
MDRWQAMRVFVKVVETGGFAAAARHLHMSPPAVTRTISSLEDTIGVRLLTRTTRAVKTTEAGDRYLDDCRRILADIAEAEASAAGLHGNPTGTLTVTGPALFGQMHILPILLEYLDQYPLVTLQSVFVDRIVNLVDEGIDVAIRIGNLPDSGLSAIRVGSIRRVVCGAPSYFEKYGVPEVPSDLVNHRIIAPTAAWASFEWQFGQKNRTSVTVRPRLQCNTNDAAIAAAEQGWGITRILSYQIAPALQEGRLQTVLSEYEEHAMPVHVVHAEGRRASAKVRSFVDLAVDRLRSNRVFN